MKSNDIGSDVAYPCASSRKKTRSVQGLEMLYLLTFQGFWLRMVLKMGEVCKPITRLADWRCSMATSSFVERIRVNNPKVMEEYVAAMELTIPRLWKNM